MIKSESYYILLSEEILSVEDCSRFIADDSCGAESFFIGKVRDHNLGKDILSLEFSAYSGMAIKEMEKIAISALKKFDIGKIAIHHRTGLLVIGEIPVIIAVSSVHRKDAFDACQYAIDTLKKTVPIWKKESSVDGSHWINAHP